MNSPANAISPLPNGDIYISFRRPSNMIGLIDKQTKKMKWQHRDDTFDLQLIANRLRMATSRCFANGITPRTNRVSRAAIELDPRTGKIVWEYRRPSRATRSSSDISGTQRLPTGNTLICEGQWGRLFEITPDGEIVWEYVSPFMGPDRFGDLSNEVSAPTVTRQSRRRYAIGSPLSTRTSSQPDGPLWSCDTSIAGPNGGAQLSGR